MSEMHRGKVQTVRGPVDPRSLGMTMMHEHVFFDGSTYFSEPSDDVANALSKEPLTLENLWRIRYNPFENRDILVFDDLDTGILEVRRFAEAGGGTLVDATPRVSGAPRPVEDLALVSKAAGVKIVKGCGHYIDGFHPEEDRVPHKTVDEITAGIVHDLQVGAGDSGMRAGIIGEIGCSWPLTHDEEKVLRAAAQAQGATGAAITIHPGRNEGSPTEIRDILAEAGVDLARVIIGHIDRTGFELETKRDLLGSGCVPRVRLLRVGGAQRTVYGGHGFGHILRNVVPLMYVYGLERPAVEQILELTPQRLLTIV